MVLDDTSMNWFRLRERRSSLQVQSKLSLTAGRRQTFAAAMGQLEEQFNAAKVVTAATRPLNLYYGLWPGRHGDRRGARGRPLELQ